MGADRTLFWDINHLSAATAWAHGFMAAYALWGGLVALTLIWTICALGARRRDDGFRSLATVVLTGAATLVGLALNQIIGPLVDRPRPFVAMPHVVLLLSHSADPSFPSDHAVIAGAFAAGLLLVSRRWGVVAVVLAVFLAFARVYCGVHYPLDVTGGLVIGAAVALLVVAVARMSVARLLTALARTPLRPVLAATSVRSAPSPAHPLPAASGGSDAPGGAGALSESREAPDRSAGGRPG